MGLAVVAMMGVSKPSGTRHLGIVVSSEAQLRPLPLAVGMTLMLYVLIEHMSK